MKIPAGTQSGSLTFLVDWVYEQEKGKKETFIWDNETLETGTGNTPERAMADYVINLTRMLRDLADDARWNANCKTRLEWLNKRIVLRKDGQS